MSQGLVNHTDFYKIQRLKRNQLLCFKRDGRRKRNTARQPRQKFLPVNFAHINRQTGVSNHTGTMSAKLTLTDLAAVPHTRCFAKRHVGNLDKTSAGSGERDQTNKKREESDMTAQGNNEPGKRKQ